MHVLFISNYFPPEVNAPATRLDEHARQWVKDGGSLEIITAAPNFPEGVVHHGYRNQFVQEETNGIYVTRVPMYIAENKGTLNRSLSYISFMISAIWYSRRTRQVPDVVVASSPQFFSGLAGYIISRLKRVPFVLEIRDLWPDSIVAVGALRRNWLIRLFEKLEHFLYREAHHIVVVTNSFKRIIASRGVNEEKITVLKNGADLEDLSQPLDEQVLEEIKQRHELKGKFVASYIGTIGMAHRADILLEAARRCPHQDVVFMVVGAGSEREALASRAAKLSLPNFRMIEKQPKLMVRYYLAASDVCVVHLRDVPLFRTVIPSKIFEAMAARKPIALGLKGEAQEIVEGAGAGIPFPPEDVDALLGVVTNLHCDRALYEVMAGRGYSYVRTNCNRKKLARAYWRLLESVVYGKKCTD